MPVLGPPDAMEAHFSVAFAALVIIHYFTDATWLQLKEIVVALFDVRSAKIQTSVHRISAKHGQPKSRDLGPLSAGR